VYKKILLTISLSSTFFCLFLNASWLSSAGNALKAVGSTGVNIVSGAAQETLNVAATSLATGGAVSPTAVAQLDYCRRLASIPGGTMSLDYQRRCGNMAVTCQQVRLSNPGATMDPYCATVSGQGQMVGPWGAATSPMMGGMNTTSVPAGTDPAKIGWSVPAPPPYGMTMGAAAGGYGAYGVTQQGAAGFGAMLADNMIGSMFSGGSLGTQNHGSVSGGRTYSADYPED
jgi:hypothetical protein